MKHLKLSLLIMGILIAVACGSSETAVTPSPTTESVPPTTENEPDEAVVDAIPTESTPVDSSTETAETMSTELSMRESGLQVTMQNLGDITIHSLTAPEALFANSTHILETSNSLILIDTQFLLPMALDYRAYADSLNKPIERLLITHEHPDHFLGSEAFADVDVYALSEVSGSIETNGQAEVDEKQGQFGDAIASTFVIPTVLEPSSIEIDGVTFVFDVVENAEAEIQLVTKLPAYGVIAVGDIVYSGVHLILAGQPPTWIEALETLKAEGAEYPIVLAGHGVPTTPEAYDENIAWLAKAGELMGTATSAEVFKTGLVEAFPDLGMDAAIDFVLPFLFPTIEEALSMGTLEVITVELVEGVLAEDFLPTNQAIKDDYVSQQSGFLARETAVTEDNKWRISVHWVSKADSDASIAEFNNAPNIDNFIGNLNTETMVMKQYELLSSTSEEVTFPSAGAVEVITVRLQDGADVEDFLAANRLIEENHITKQPGFVARQIGVTEDGEWMIVIHWEIAEDSAASIASFDEAPDAELFMSFFDLETMMLTVYDIQQ